MSSAEFIPPSPDAVCAELQEQTLQACRLARIAAGIVAEGIATGVPSLSDGVREREKELDTLDRVIDQGVTSVITKVDEEHARELLACLKFIIDLERIGDLLLNCSNRAAAVGSRIELQDIRDLTHDGVASGENAGRCARCLQPARSQSRAGGVAFRRRARSPAQSCFPAHIWKTTMALPARRASTCCS